MNRNGGPQQEKVDRIVAEIGRLNDRAIALAALLGSKPDHAWGQTHWALLTEVVDAIEKLKQAQYGGHTRDKEVSIQQRSRTQINSFLKWLRENKVADADKLRIEQSGEAGLGVFAHKDMKKGQIAISVPSSIMLSTYTVWEHPQLKKFFQKEQIASSESLLLALFLLSEQYNASSFWHAYIQILPKSYTLPCYWGLNEFKMLEDSSLLLPAVWSLITPVRYYHTVFMSLGELNYPINPFEFTWDRFIWAFSTVYTRQNKIPNLRHAGVKAAAQKLVDATIQRVTGVNPEELRSEQPAEEATPAPADDSPLANREMILALIPVFDMCNHKPVADSQSLVGNSQDWDYATNSMLVRPIEDIKKGDELNIFYGVRHTSDFVIANGFVPAASPFDGFNLTMKLNERDPLLEAKVNALLASGLFDVLRQAPQPQQAVIQFVVNRHRLNARTAFFFRVLAAQDANMLKIGANKDRFKSMAENDTPFDNDNEVRALTLYSLRLQQQLNRLPVTKIESAFKKLSTDPVARTAEPPVTKMLWNWLHAEQSILEDAVKTAKSKIEKKTKSASSSSK